MWCKPQEVCQKEVEFLVNYQHTVFDFTSSGIGRSSFLDRELGCHKEVQVYTILENWKLLVSDCSRSFESKCTQIAKIVSHLSNKNIESFKYYGLELEQENLVRSAIATSRMLPVENRAQQFQTSDKVSLGENLNSIDGYLFKLHHCLRLDQKSKEFLKSCGVVDHFSQNTCIDTINRIECFDDETQVSQLEDLLDALIRSNCDPRSVTQLPDTEMKFRSIQTLCLDDHNEQWHLDDQIFCTHPKLSSQTVLKFGVVTKRKKLLLMNSESIRFSFGQYENICDRIRSISVNYSDPMDVFKELIQNADDSGASEIHFLLDKRVLSQKAQSKVPDVAWEKLLEPALLVFNNSFFTTDDIDGLQKLGTGSKREKSSTIGKFGVGFNCVYSLTDTPCFLTQVDGKGCGNVFLLDPMSVIVSEPERGRRLQLSQQLIRRYSTLMESFLSSNQNLNACDGKTMYRFPLRKASKLGSSAVSKKKLGSNTGSIEEMEGRLKSLGTKINQFLLFLNHIRQIKISTVEENGLITELLSAKKEILDSIESRYRDFLHLCDSNQSESSSFVYSVKISVNDKFENWRICDYVSVPNSHFRGKSTRASVAFRTEPNLKRSDDSFPSVFCFLPLEAASNGLANENVQFPVVVNAQFKIDEYRRNVSLNDTWNVDILQNSLGPAYATLLRDLLYPIISPSKFELIKFMSYLPQLNSEGVLLTERSFVFNIFRGMLHALKDVACMPIVTKHLKFKMLSQSSDANLTNFYFCEDSSLAELKFNILYDLGFELKLKMTQLSPKLTSLLKQSGFGIQDANQNLYLNRICEGIKSATRIEETCFKNSQTLIVFLEWAKNQIISHFSPKILPIYLSSNGTLMRNNGKHKLYSSKFSIQEVFPKTRSQILDPDVENILEDMEISCEMPLEIFLSEFKSQYANLCQEKRCVCSNQSIPNMLEILHLVWQFLLANETKVEKEVISKFSILPCSDKNNRLLCLPISKGSEVIFSKFVPLKIGSVTGIQVGDFEGFYQLYPSFAKESDTLRQFLSKFVLTSCLEVEQEINILYIICTKSGFESFDDEMKMKLYSYFRESCDEFLSSGSLSQLKCLPIYETATGSFEPLQTERGVVFVVFAIEQSLPRNGILLKSTTMEKYVFQETTKRGRKFQEMLGIIDRNWLEMYILLIVPICFERLSQNEMWFHLKFLQEQVEKSDNSIKNEDLFKLFTFLKQTSFIETSSSLLVGTTNSNVTVKTSDVIMKRPPELYDDKHILFQQFEDGSLLPEYYVPFKNLLKKCGLHYKIENETEFWQFASMQAMRPHEKAGETLNYHDNMRKVSRVNDKILEELIANFVRLEIDGSKFDEFMDLSLFPTINSGLKPLNESYCRKYALILDQVSPILTKEISEFNFEQKILQRFKTKFSTQIKDLWKKAILKEPAAEQVLENLKYILDAPEKYSAEKVCLSLDFVSKHPSTLQEVKGLSCVKTKARSAQHQPKMLGPRQLCKMFKCSACLGEDCPLREYIDEPENSLLAAWDSLEKMGASSAPNLQQIIRALFQCKTECDDLNSEVATKSTVPKSKSV